MKKIISYYLHNKPYIILTLKFLQMNRYLQLYISNKMPQ